MILRALAWRADVVGFRYCMNVLLKSRPFSYFISKNERKLLQHLLAQRLWCLYGDYYGNCYDQNWLSVFIQQKNASYKKKIANIFFFWIRRIQLRIDGVCVQLENSEHTKKLHTLLLLPYIILLVKTVKPVISESIVRFFYAEDR